MKSDWEKMAAFCDSLDKGTITISELKNARQTLRNIAEVLRKCEEKIERSKTTLRDGFAMSALQGTASSEQSPGFLVLNAFAIADEAMTRR
jgi:hypothetical protein